jgi:hypothetical protein
MIDNVYFPENKVLSLVGLSLLRRKVPTSKIPEGEKEHDEICFIESA